MNASEAYDVILQARWVLPISSPPIENGCVTIDQSRIQLVGLYNDRRNYYLWARNGQRRWVENHAKVVAQAGEELYRLFNLLFMGTAGVMSDPAQTVSAYRMVLELPE